MKENKIYLAIFATLFLFGGAILLSQCKKNDLGKNKLQKKDFTSITAYMPAISGVGNNGGILAFSNMTAFNDAYELLSDSCEKHEYGDDDSSCYDDPILDAFESNLNFTSIRKIFEDEECNFLDNGGDPENFVDCHIDDDVYAAFMNSDYMVIIGEDLYYWPGNNLIYSVPLAESAKMYDFKNTNKSAHAAGVNFLTAVVLTECSAAFNMKLVSTTSKRVDIEYKGTVSGTSRFSWEIDGTHISLYDNDDNFSHTFTMQGKHKVCCTVFDDKGTPNKGDDCENEVCQEIEVASCAPSFSFTNSGPNYSFTDLSKTDQPITSWEWDFNDGSPHSFLQNPTHTFTCNADRTVTLMIKTADCLNGKSFQKSFYVGGIDCCNRKTPRFHGKFTFDDGKKKIKWVFKINMVMGLDQHAKAKMKNFHKKGNRWKKRKAELNIDFVRGDNLNSGIGELSKTNFATGCDCKAKVDAPESPSATYNRKKLKVKNKLVGFLTGTVERNKLVRLNRDDFDFHVKYYRNGVLMLDFDPANDVGFNCDE